MAKKAERAKAVHKTLPEDPQFSEDSQFYEGALKVVAIMALGRAVYDFIDSILPEGAETSPISGVTTEVTTRVAAVTGVGLSLIREVSKALKAEESVSISLSLEKKN